MARTPAQAPSGLATALTVIAAAGAACLFPAVWLITTAERGLPARVRRLEFPVAAAMPVALSILAAWPWWRGEPPWLRAGAVAASVVFALMAVVFAAAARRETIKPAPRGDHNERLPVP